MLIPIALIHKTNVVDERVGKYRAMLHDGKELTPIRVRRWGAGYVCLDGAHRVAAAWRRASWSLRPNWLEASARAIEGAAAGCWKHPAATATTHRLATDGAP